MPSGSLELPQMPLPAYDFLLYLAERRQRKETAMYNGYTESDEEVKARWERWKIGGYGYFPKADEAKQEAEAIPVSIQTLEMIVAE